MLQAQNGALDLGWKGPEPPLMEVHDQAHCQVLVATVPHGPVA